MNQRIEMLPVDDTGNRLAREAAHRRISWPINLTPSSVAYVSAGHALILGNERDARRAARELRGRGLASLTLAITGPADPETEADDETLLADTRSLACQTLTREQAASLRVEGYLGRFSVTLGREQPLNLGRALVDREYFDLVLDLGETPILALELPPPGYVTLRWAEPDRAARLEAFADLVGEFDKPRYFQLNHDLCAHSSSGNTGCTRCLEVCPADAIASRQGRIEAWIEIDPFRCHGVGSCSSACPTGAIQFRLPETHRQQETLLAWLEAYRQAGGTLPVVRFVAADHQASDDDPAGHVLDVPLEELGAAGHDQWLTALAGGAAEVRVQRHPRMPERLTAFIDDQLALARALLEALGHSPERVTGLEAGDTAGRDALPAHPPLVETPLAFDTAGKRDHLNAVLTRLLECGKPDGRRHAMPAGAAYGGLDVDSAACTLCMACVAGCPTPALAAGGDSPRLSFREADCVQCGLCAEACPEDAITLLPGFLADPARSERRVCHEEEAFDCIRCGKPFATAGTIATIKAKLADHPYFAGDALSRLEMCEDCRVRDVWRELARDPESQLKV
ncbi:4Fe-4S binding protein [Halomonas heilongjiangensis]|uniref:4Fe-4S ferredoxin n=1 Tax=Halomonas heilongjiangensis TaxID=1387883 RepID=A0A2N7TR15_9GAMM|nr:4Fe-4S binding protein [Halomonas heilongjiangensis]PMR70629.1 4Fe-4S ferredoxin [Halomonas heilongjiangensis]PXX88815.1 4Fe-4S ferredoxin [Halomonas heilongjiangensis]